MATDKNNESKTSILIIILYMFMGNRFWDGFRFETDVLDVPIVQGGSHILKYVTTHHVTDDPQNVCTLSAPHLRGLILTCETKLTSSEQLNGPQTLNQFND